MRDHGYLCILRADGEPGEYERIAESNSAVPVLWKILLADGAAASNAVLRVLDGAARQALTVDAESGLQRYVRFAQFLLQHDVIDAVPGLRLYLQAARQHLRELIDDWTEADAATPLLCVTFDEFAGVANVSMHSRLSDCDECWRQLESALHRQDLPMVERQLTLARPNLRSGDWRVWSELFGLALFEHEYFSGAFRQPREVAYVDFRYDELGDDDELGAGLVRFKANERWGVRRGESTVLEACWDRILRSGVQGLVWIQREHRYGLAAIDGERAGRVLLDPSLDSVSPFEDGLALVAVVDKCGYLRTDGRWHLEPQWDDAWPFRHRAAVVTQQDRLGYIDERGAFIWAPQFDAADHFSASQVARVRKGSMYGLVRFDGKFALDPVCTELEWSQALQGWIFERDGHRGLLRADGHPWIEARWDGIEPCASAASIRVTSGGKAGVLDRQGDLAVPCKYRTLTELTVAGRTLFIAEHAGRSGVIDGYGNTVLALQYTVVEPMESQRTEEGEVAATGLVRVRATSQRGRPKAGIWDLAAGRQRVPCDYDYVWLAALGTGGRHGFIVADKKFIAATEREFRVGLLSAQGAVLIDPIYAWIGDRSPPTTLAAAQKIRGAIYDAWSRGDAVSAVRTDGSRESLSPPCVPRTVDR